MAAKSLDEVIDLAFKTSPVFRARSVMKNELQDFLKDKAVGVQASLVRQGAPKEILEAVQITLRLFLIQVQMPTLKD